MIQRKMYAHLCQAMVSNSVSNILGKVQCSRKPMTIGGLYCKQHQPEAVQARQKAAADRHAPRELLTPFEEWFRKEYPLYLDIRDRAEKEALRRCWNAAAEACAEVIRRLS